MKQRLFLFILFIPFWHGMDAQISFGQLDREYFEQQLPRYQTWLEAKGIADAFKVYEIVVEAKALTLILVSTDANPDVAKARWTELQHSFEKAGNGQLSHRLFTRFCQLMEIPLEMGVIELYNEITLDKVPCFYRGIFFEDGQLQTEVVPCMNQSAAVQLDPLELNLDSPAAKTLVGKKGLNRQLETHIREMVDDHFTSQPKAKVVYLTAGGDLLRFEVTDLQREVLTDEANPMLARLLNTFGLGLDWVKREFLTFYIRSATNEEGELEIQVEINGKYGSGFHRPRRNAYIDMEPEFESYLAKYADVFAQKIRDHLIGKRP